MNKDPFGEAPTAAGAPAVDAQHPWLGLASFTEETRGYFYGREDEVGELARRVQRKLLTILFGQSGLGKTSILRAGIVPRLRPEGYCPVYVRIDYSRESPPPSEQIKRAIFEETQASGEWTQTGVAAGGESLWEFLHHRDDVLRDASGRTLIPLLIFDQFEEIFTLAQSDDFGRQRAAQFLEDLADLVENRAPKALEARMEQDDATAEKFDFARADYRILIALREDYLAHLEGLKGLMPSITQNRMRLARMTGAQALQAVMKPGGRLVSEEVAAAIVRFTAGGSELPNAEVEPSLLSLICRELNNARIAQGRGEISADLLAGSRDTILSEFYERALAGEPPGVRQVIEDHLLTESGYRENLAEERLSKLFTAAGAPPGALAKLVDRRLLRIEERLDVRRVELTHDVLCGVVKASRDLRLERDARDEAERQLEAQRRRERATRQALVRARKIAAACGVLAVVAVAGAIFGWFSMKRAQEAEAQAEQIRLMAEAARGEAEKLVVYLLDDFHLELAPVGRLDIVGELAKRALDYYNALPQALRTPQTERNRALALVRYGSVLRTQARLAEGRKAVDDAVQVLGTMRAEGDQSETTAIGLALGLSTQARLASSVNDDAAALLISTRAAEAIRALATVPNASVAARRAYGEVLNMHGFLLMRNRQLEPALAALDDARAAFRGIDDLTLTDLAAAAGYAEAASWQVQAYSVLGRREDAKRAGSEGLSVAAKVLDKRPGHMQALRAQALTTSPLSGVLADEMRLAEALAMVDATRRAWSEFVRMDPSNAISWNNLAVSHFIKANILETMGRPADAAATWRSTQDLEAQAPANLMLKNSLGLHAGRLALLEAQRGRRREAEAALALAASHNGWVSENAPAGSWDRLSRPAFRKIWPVAVADALGDHRAALELGRVAAPDLDRLKPSVPSASTREYAFVRLILHHAMATSAYALGDFSAADREMALVLAARNELRDSDDIRGGVYERTFAALVKVRLDQPAEARALIEPALKFQRELAKRNVDDPSQRIDLAAALCVAAVAGVGDSAAQLAEAATLMDKLPPEMKRLSYVEIWRNRIADARSGRRPT
jgi:hypothetical protein